ncbi:MAG: YfiR family protein [Desulfobacterales bacterium]|nr:YfiR family protein [Desulfobacterales bacterium]
MRDVNCKTRKTNRPPSGERRGCVDGAGVRSEAPRRPAGRFRVRARGRLAVWLLIGALALPTFLEPVRAASFKEYQLKAVFLYNFINFVTWPDEAFQAPERPFTIGILGEDPFGTFLEKVIATETFKGKPVMLKHGDAVQDLAHCQILFIGKTNRGRLDAVLESAPPRHVLTVGDHEGFIKAGGMVNLVHAGQRVRIEINVQRVHGAGLGVSSKLLRVAKIVTE